MSTEESSVEEVVDPYIFLEEVESEESIAFAKMANEKCLARLGDPSDTDTYKRVLSALESKDRQVYDATSIFYSFMVFGIILGE
jgi:prolyl oligopeptidase PreP (S9A serine peptidase family)